LGVVRYRGCDISKQQLASIGEMMRVNPGISRWKLSRQLCEAWDWKQANGALRDMVCRSFLLELERSGHIQLPPARRQTRNYLVQRERPEPVIADTRPVRDPVTALRTAIEFHQVRRTPQEALFNGLMEQYHYLGYQQPVGEHVKYLVTANEQVIACLALSSAPRHLGLQHAVSDPAMGRGAASGVASAEPDGDADIRGLGTDVCAPDSSAGDICGSTAFSRHLLSGSQLGVFGIYNRAWQK
jgi:hypothetical protein